MKLKTFSNATQVVKYFSPLYGKSTMAQFERYGNLIAAFKKTFSARSCHLASSSGRVEFVGNHTDHNGGSVIGCAINLDIVAAFCPNNDGMVRIAGNNRKFIQFAVADVDTVEPTSRGLVKGVLAYLKANGHCIGGFDAYLNSVLPTGAGISSSAAFEMLVATVQNALYNNGAITTQEMAKAGQFAENVYFGKPCGLLDQSVVAIGGAVLLNFANGVAATPITVPQNLFKLVLVDTGKSHAGLNDLYASIPAEMQAVAAHFGATRLADVDEQTFCQKAAEVQNALGMRPYLRAKHFFEENARVLTMQNALNEANCNQIVEVINASGNSSLTQLQNCAVDATDTAIADAISYARSVCPCGARVHGGGFAGTVLCVVPQNCAKTFVENLSAQYGINNVMTLSVRPVGATVLN